MKHIEEFNTALLGLAKDMDLRDPELNEELVGILTAISVVSKRLAKKLRAFQRRSEPTTEGGISVE